MSSVQNHTFDPVGCVSMFVNSGDKAKTFQASNEKNGSNKLLNVNLLKNIPSECEGILRIHFFEPKTHLAAR